MAMAMKAFYAFGQGGGHLCGDDSKARTRSGGIVQIGFNMRVFGVDTQATTDLMLNSVLHIPLLHHGIESMELREAIEGDVR